jgi:hypothetical protein
VCQWRKRRLMDVRTVLSGAAASQGVLTDPQTDNFVLSTHCISELYYLLVAAVTDSAARLEIR